MKDGDTMLMVRLWTHYDALYFWEQSNEISQSKGIRSNA